MTEENATTGSPGSAEPKPQAQGVQDELTALINEGATETKPDLTKDLKEVVSFVQSQQAETFNKNFREDMDVAVKAIQDVVPEEASKFVTPGMIEGYLHKLANEDEAVKDAFLQRRNKPEAWAQTQKSLVESFSKQFKETPDPNISEDREAVIAAAKTKTEKPEVGDVMKMDKADFDAEQKKHGVRPYGT